MDEETKARLRAQLEGERTMFANVLEIARRGGASLDELEAMENDMKPALAALDRLLARLEGRR